MSNRSFNETVVPALQPDPARPHSTDDHADPVPAAIRPRRGEPETGFARGQPWDGYDSLMSGGGDLLPPMTEVGW